MNKKAEVIRCYFVPKNESDMYIRINHLSNKITHIDCNAKIRQKVNGKYVYTYCNGESIINRLYEEKSNNNLKILPNDPKEENEYKYMFCYNDIVLKFIVPKQQKANDDFHFVDAMYKLNNLVKYNHKKKYKINKLNVFKATVATVLAGTLGASAVSFIKKHDKPKSYEERDVYSTFYEGTMTKYEFENMANNLQESINRTK